MRIAIIGGGFTGLSAAYELVKKGHRVTVFEKEKTLGGLAHGFKKKNWDWHLESAYHHLFTNDHAILRLIDELGLHNQLLLTRPTTANYVSVIPANAGIQSTKLYHSLDSGVRRNDEILPFDSPLHLLTYPGLSFLDKLRTCVLIALAKLYPAPFQWCGVNPFWQPLEWISAKKLFTVIGGTTAWRLLWEPLMIGKFGDYADRVSASWLWARIKKRTQKLYYIHGGFHTLVSSLERAIKHYGGTIYNGIQLDTLDQLDKFDSFDSVLLTTPTPIAAKLLSNCQLSTVKGQLSSSIPHLHAQTLILETNEPILKDIYWLNIMDRSFPFLAVVAHTNMVDKKHYGGHHITYFGNYLPSGHPYLSMNKKQLLAIFLPFMLRITHNSKFIIHNSFLFTAPFAQPVHELHYSRRAPKMETPIPGIFLANMDSIYPWDRGTNYAVELGQKAANTMLCSQGISSG